MGAKLAVLRVDKLKVAIYVRVSTQYQVDRASLPVQKEELVNYAKYVLGIDDFEIFEDAGYSAKNTDRPDFQKMMARIRTGEFSHILVWKIDRISRNLLDFAAMYEELKQLGVTFVSKNEQFDTSSAVGEAMLKIILIFAELERNMTSERVSAVMLSRASSGVWNGGRIPYGYSYSRESKEFSINDSEARVVEMIYNLYESKRSLIKVSKHLNERGLRTRNGGAWNPVSVRKILVSPFYVGAYRYNYYDESSKSFKKKPEDEWVLVENHHVALIDAGRQERIISILESQQRNGMGKATYFRKNIHIFAGLLTCGCCGSQMVCSQDRVRSGGWRPSIYMCSRRRRFNDCSNKYVSDITLGPFVFNFIANLVKVSHSFGKSTSIETLEKKLLRGETFSDVSAIGRDGLKALYMHLRSGFTESILKPPVSDKDSDMEQHSILVSEKLRTERALNRLRTLYLYSEESMPEKDYVIQKKKLSDELEDINAQLAALEKRSKVSSLSDEEFVAKATYFIMTQKLMDKRHVNFEHFIRAADAKIVKNFIDFVVQNFCILDGKIRSIVFKNGLELKFYYKSEQNDKSPETL